MVFVLGSINLDIVGFCPRQPRPGETILGTGLERFPGGKGANQAVAAALAGCATRMVGAVGDDGAGKELLAFLASKNVDVSLVRSLAGVPTGTALILVSTDGQNSIVVIPGANGQVDVAALEGEVPLFAGDVCLAQLEVPLDEVSRLFRTARLREATTILNPSPFQPIPAVLLADTDVLIVNETEYSGVTGLPLAASVEELERQVRQHSLLARRADVVTLGPAGALVKTRDECLRLAGVVVEAVDTTGAGDCFAGYFAALIGEGLTLGEAARVANAAAALSVTRNGAGSSIPTRGAVESFLASR